MFIVDRCHSPELMGKQFVAAENWKGTCGLLSKIIQPTLIIVGTGDVVDPAPNSLMLAEKIPGSWLLQIRDAGHGLMYQYPNEFDRVLATFLEIYR
ncbi:MAG: alpha/beta hydrolase [Candidatus Nitrosopolaris sp.]